MVEHGLYVRRNGHSLFTKPQEDSSKPTGLVRALVQHVIERLSHKRGRTVKHDADLSWLARLVNTMVRYVPGGAVREALLIGGHFVCISFGENVFHESLIILVLLRVSFQLFLQPNGALPGLGLDAGYRCSAICINLRSS